MEDNKTPGQPRIYNSVEEMDLKIEEYFDDICGDQKIKGTDEIRYKPPTMEALTYHLGFATRKSISDYKKTNKEYKFILDRAKQKILAELWDRSLTNNLNARMSEFNLKNNFGYKDKQEIDLSNAPDRKFEHKITPYERTKEDKTKEDK